MRRNASLLAALSLAVVVAGCKSTEKGDSTYADPTLGLYDDYTPPAPETALASASTTSDPYESYTPPAEPAPTSRDMNVQSDALSSQYHTVSKGDTLYALARQYYSDQRRWKDIFEANRGQISDPNKIRVGQRLLIP